MLLEKIQESISEDNISRSSSYVSQKSKDGFENDYEDCNQFAQEKK